MTETYPSVPGTYIIYNRVLNAAGQRLALTFNGNDQAVTGTPLDPQSTKQRWVISKYGAGKQGGFVYELKPVDNPSVEAATISSSSNVLTVRPNAYVFSIYKDDSGYTISNGLRQNPWALESATDGSRVVFAGALGERQRWCFHNIADGDLQP